MIRAQLVDALELLFAEARREARAEAAKLLAESGSASVYSNASLQTLPPDLRGSLENRRRAFCTFIREHRIPGVQRCGRDVSVPRHAWHAARAKATARGAASRAPKLRLVPQASKVMNAVPSAAEGEIDALAAAFMAAAPGRRIAK